MKRKQREDKLDYNFHNDYDYYDDDEIDLMDLLFIIVRRWKVIILTAIPIIIIGFFFALTRPSVYKAETTLMVSSGMNSIGLDNSEVSLNQKLVVTYSEVAKSRSILKRVINKYDLAISPESLAGSISISPVKSTELLKLSYKNTDPKLASAVTNEFAREFMDKISSVMNIRNVKVVELAEIPDRPLPKKRVIILAAFIILGIMTGVGLAFVVEFLHKKLRKSEEIEKILEAPLLGVVPVFDRNENTGILKGEE